MGLRQRAGRPEVLLHRCSRSRLDKRARSWEQAGEVGTEAAGEEGVEELRDSVLGWTRFSRGGGVHRGCRPDLKQRGSACRSAGAARRLGPEHVIATGRVTALVSKDQQGRKDKASGTQGQTSERSLVVAGDQGGVIKEENREVPSSEGRRRSVPKKEVLNSCS